MHNNKYLNKDTVKFFSLKNSSLNMFRYSMCASLLFACIGFVSTPAIAQESTISLEETQKSIDLDNIDTSELSKKIAADLNVENLADSDTKEDTQEQSIQITNNNSNNTAPSVSKNYFNKQSDAKIPFVLAKRNIDFVKAPSEMEYVDLKIKPVDLGQAYIGIAYLSDYELYWEKRIEDLGMKDKCRYFMGKDSFAVYGDKCIQLNSFDRLEAHSDENGKLAAIIYSDKLETPELHNDILTVLNSRYTPLDAQNTPIKNVYELNNDLCSVMTRLAKASFRCNVSWYKYNDVYISYTYSTFKGSLKATLMYASEDYLLQIEQAMLKRRLALVRQELDRNITTGEVKVNMTASY